MRFWKMNGAGNDFVVLNNLEEHLPAECLPQAARTLCQRHLSIGADGLMVVDAPTQGGDYKMLFFNSDGSVGEMCGNGARCICRYGYELGLAGETQTVETTAGIVTGRRITQRLYRVRLNDPTTVKLDAPVEVDGIRHPCSYVELGNPGLPHAVVPYPNLRDAGESQRGVEDFTYACGTGTGSVVAVLTLLGRVTGRNVRVDMKGGTLTIDVEHAGSQVTGLYLTGPTNVVCKGEVTDEDLNLF